MEIKGAKKEYSIDGVAHRLSNNDGRELEEKDLSAADVDQAVDAALVRLTTFAHEASEQPSHFWLRQRAAIRSRIAIKEASKKPWKGLLWLAGVAVLLLVSLITMNRSVMPAPQNVTDPDQELLMTVERTVQSGGPDALEPAALLAQEISNAESESSTRSKEKANAN
jgi:hypothetical protein